MSVDSRGLDTDAVSADTFLNHCSPPEAETLRCSDFFPSLVVLAGGIVSWNVLGPLAALVLSVLGMGLVVALALLRRAREERDLAYQALNCAVVDLAEAKRIVTTTQAHLAQREAALRDQRRAALNIAADAKAAELRARLAQDETQMRNEQLDKFAYVISHDLKAPLRGIRTCVGWLLEDLSEADLTEDVQENLAFLASRTERLGSLIDGVLMYSRAGRVAQNRTDVDLKSVLSDVARDFSEQEQQRLRWPRPLPVVYGDISQLFQLFQNLISNALKHGAENGPVDITWAEDPTHFRFSVIDVGPGISPEHHERVFELFSTLKPRDELETAGVGLSVCRTIVERHQGVIGIDSSAGNGCTVWFTLPRRSGSDPSLAGETLGDHHATIQHIVG